MVVWIVILAVLVLLVIGAVWAYNGMVRRKQRVAEAWSQIDVELKRRHDLIPRVVETVKGYAAHERGVFDEVTQARSAAISAGRDGSAADVAAAENTLSSTLRSLFAVAENYPALQAVQSFLDLQEQLMATEDKLEYARRYYNGSARDYNSAIQSFPRVLLARPLGFPPVGYYAAAEADREAPTVDFAPPPAGPTA